MNRTFCIHNYHAACAGKYVLKQDDGCKFNVNNKRNFESPAENNIG